MSRDSDIIQAAGRMSIGQSREFESDTDSGKLERDINNEFANNGKAFNVIRPHKSYGKVSVYCYSTASG